MIPHLPPSGWEPSARWATPSEAGGEWRYSGFAWRAMVKPPGPRATPQITIDGCGIDAREWMSGEAWTPDVAPGDLMRLALYRAEKLVDLLDAGTIARVRS